VKRKTTLPSVRDALRAGCDVRLMMSRKFEALGTDSSVTDAILDFRNDLESGRDVIVDHWTLANAIQEVSGNGVPVLRELIWCVHADGSFEPLEDDRRVVRDE
jgi:hypothetical protein